jgi:hypothetical protein
VGGISVHCVTRQAVLIDLYCDFIVWTPKGINVETVETIVVGDQFMKNILPKLKHFYFKSTVQSLDTFLYPEFDSSGFRLPGNV